MSSDSIVKLSDLGKCYHLYDKPRDRLKQMLARGRRNYHREFWALQDISFEVARGETVGVIGRNGAGKSTLLQIVCGTLSHSVGELDVSGRVAGLLELGAGFNPEFTGHENVYLNAAVLGLSDSEIDERYDQIVDFSEIGEAIHQPVKTYSSGMFLRLAFSVATSVDPDILVVDEALSVGDGAFARKSFDRIMGMKRKGTTVFFCSHSLYQVEALCDRTLWLDQGRLRMIGNPAEVTHEYSTELGRGGETTTGGTMMSPAETKGRGRITTVQVAVDGETGASLLASCMESTLSIDIGYCTDPQLPPPSVLVGISLMEGMGVTGAGTVLDGLELERDEKGYGRVELEFPKIPLLKGTYLINVYLACEQGVHCYDTVLSAATVKVTQERLEQGVVILPHQWKQMSI